MQPKKRRKRRYAAPIGGLFIFLAVVGVLTIVLSSMKLTGQLLDNTKEKDMFEDLIRPVVMFDPVPFEKITDVKAVSLLQYSMWATLTGERRNSFAQGDNAEMIVPASDLDVEAGRLFGPDAVLEHQSFGDYVAPYSYDAKTQTYSVPISAQLFVYTPQVIEIQKDKDYYNLTVGYIPPGNAWTTGTGGNKNAHTPDKYMIYVMKKVKNDYQIVAVRDITAEQAAQLPSNYNR